ncbi:MAG: metallopeptidase family protein [Chloroflexi bacterium]|nr:metallopeptidase family protein [Chloroflexota bacterium]MCI0821987.1 metallopeptidase family protein [Chloroflexota bacterium]MCI0868998.1 metallopeptidase family protein [Chloroflexota bacterium]MCI0886997.1 metallopeptidase family protein [Chloroflexota bacterium]
METSEFEVLVHQALDQIPPEIRMHLDNVDLVVEEWPSNEQLVGSGIEKEQLLLGLYEGLPLTERSDYGMVLPDKITLFQKSIEEICDTREEIVEEVRETVVHEVAHHFGISDERLEELGV